MNKEKFAIYLAELEKWNKSINLVQGKTIPDILNRHIIDSLQLKKHINYKEDNIVDIGSGAGFPGMILAIDGAKKVRLVEPVTKKVVFLKHIKNLYHVNVTVHNERWEELRVKNATIITSRAYAVLNKLLEAMYFVSRETESPTGLFLKGQKIHEEIKHAKENWNFESEIFKSETSETGCIIKIWSLKKNDG